MLGRVRNTDRVSRDGELWEPVTQVPELIPEELLDLDSAIGFQRFVQVRSGEDDRSEATAVAVERRTELEAMEEQIRTDWSVVNKSSSSEQNSVAWSALPWSLLGITLGALGIVLYLNSSGGV